MRRTLVLVCATGLALPAIAVASGGPVQTVQGGAGVSSGTDSSAFVATAVGRDTLVQRVRGSVVVGYRVVRGAYGIPAVALDGSATGLSADGSTLVLAEAPGRIDRTRLLPLDARNFRPRAVVTLPGLFTVDAISPDGATLYLVHYTAPRTDDTRYEVRAYDLPTHRLLPSPIVDPREPDEKMTGVPLTRVTSPDGRWAYTLYDGEEPFVHALDTQAGTAVCIDLARLDHRAAYTARLRLDGSTLHVGDLALVNTRTFAVTVPGTDAVPSTAVADTRPVAVSVAPSHARDAVDSGRLIAAVATVVAGVFAALALLLRWWRRPRGVEPTTGRSGSRRVGVRR